MNKRQMSKTTARRISMTITYLILIACAVVCIFPFFWMLTTAFKSTAEA